MNFKLNNDSVVSYLEVSKIIKYLKNIVAELSLNIDETFLILLCCKVANINYDELCGYKWRANHYLKDALDIKEIPNSNLIKETLNVSNIQELADIHKLILFLGGKSSDATSVNCEDVLNYTSKILTDLLEKKKIIKTDSGLLSEKQKKNFENDGFLIIPSVLSEEETDKLAKLTLFIAKKEDEAGVAYRYGGETNKIQRIYNLISKHPKYIELLELPLIVDILEYYFKDNSTRHHRYVLSSFQSNIVYPGGPAQQLHVDGFGATSSPLPPWPIRLNVNFLLTDWKKNNGASSVVKNSHKLCRVPTPEEIENSKLTKVIAPKGSLALWTGHTWHKSGANQTDQPRFGLFACFAASQLKEVSTEEEHLLVVDKKTISRMSPEMRFMIGLDRGIKQGATYKHNFSSTEFNI